MMFHALAIFPLLVHAASANNLRGNQAAWPVVSSRITFLQWSAAISILACDHEMLIVAQLIIVAHCSANP